MPTSPSSVVKEPGPLNSCAPELSRISSAIRSYSSGRLRVAGAASTTYDSGPWASATRSARVLVCSASRVQPAAAVNVTPRPTSTVLPAANGRSAETRPLSRGRPTAMSTAISATTTVPGQPRRSSPRNPPRPPLVTTGSLTGR